MLAQLRPAFVMIVLFTALTGLAYPLAITAVAGLVFPDQAAGSLVRREDGTVIGSSVVGQAFTQERYFQSRPSAAGDGYDAAASSGSNLGPTSRALVERVKADVARLRGSDGRPVPVDLVTASASGLDPDLSPEAALYQVPRIAAERGLPAARLEELVREHIEDRWLGLFGQPRVNLLALNMALDRLQAPG
jgi:K+-transporting ATPase ATPase C chain